MKRILFLVSSMQGGGAERVAALLCNHWAAQGHHVMLMPTFSGRGECLYPLDERVRLEYLADRVVSRSRSMFNNLYRFIALRRVIAEIRPDVIVSFLPHVNVAAVLSAWRLRVPVVVSERTYPPAIQLGGSRATGVVLQTQQALKWLEQCCPRARGQVIPNPVVYPLPFGKPVLEPASVVASTRRVVLAVGRLAEEKGFEQLLTAFGVLAPQYPEWELVILGEGLEREALEQQRERLGLNDRVHLPGRVGNLSDWYARADLYVMSSRFEGFPNTLVEAMAMGCPVIATDCESGPREIIRDGQNGLLVPVEDDNALAQALLNLMGNAQLRLLLSSAALAVRERFSKQVIIRKWQTLIEEVLST